MLVAYVHCSYCMAAKQHLILMRFIFVAFLAAAAAAAAAAIIRVPTPTKFPGLESPGK